MAAIVAPFKNSKPTNPRPHLSSPLGHGLQPTETQSPSPATLICRLKIAMTPFRGIVFLDYSASLSRASSAHCFLVRSMTCSHLAHIVALIVDVGANPNKLKSTCCGLGRHQLCFLPHFEAPTATVIPDPTQPSNLFWLSPTPTSPVANSFSC
ncbi:hypothetical protein C1H46_024042 [Malus baccata]|uniref:Uncharacterized protein n=1 Tax=Malus baccata TaxID=106549 RepID=A0A540LV81_MALBA|nr:hypothetical protein C1H46_024042 [Malus baccata]